MVLTSKDGSKGETADDLIKKVKEVMGVRV